MQSKIEVPKDSLFLAPMEGVTNESYRMALEELYPKAWDFMACDFHRIPSVGITSPKKLLQHYGETIYSSSMMLNNYYQVLVSTRSQIQPTIENLQKLNFPWIDLNLGCPSKSVNGHKGGSYLLSDLFELKKILLTMRDTHKGFLSAKIRLGYKDTDSFLDILKLLEDSGIEMITIHGRTKEQMYKGIANWDFIKLAVEKSSLPIIANGDVWTLEDLYNVREFTGCHGVMMARGAMKTPWLSELAKEYSSNLLAISQDQAYLNEIRKEKIPEYFKTLEKYMIDIPAPRILNKFKSLSRYLFDDLDTSHKLRSSFLRAQSLETFKERLENLRKL